MRGGWLFVIGAACGAAGMGLPRAAAHLRRALNAEHVRTPEAGATRAHTEEAFAFIANAPVERVVPLFGADQERVWAPGWNPRFVHPVPAVDKEGMVFTAAHDHLSAVWVNTIFDEKNGRIAYVYVIPDGMATVIRLKLTPQGEQTRVEVEYDRTALSPEADEHVRHMAEGDRRSGPAWEKQVNEYLRRVEKGS